MRGCLRLRFVVPLDAQNRGETLVFEMTVVIEAERILEKSIHLPLQSVRLVMLLLLLSLLLVVVVYLQYRATASSLPKEGSVVSLALNYCISNAHVVMEHYSMPVYPCHVHTLFCMCIVT